jgi:hypothetical protein
MSNIHDHEPNEDKDKEIVKYIKCRTCGGYGYNFNTEHGNARLCDSCLGDKISRDPRDYKDRKDIPPLRK